MLSLRVKFEGRIADLYLQVNIPKSKNLKTRSSKIGQNKIWDCYDIRDCINCIYGNYTERYICILSL